MVHARAAVDDLVQVLFDFGGRQDFVAIAQQVRIAHNQGQGRLEIVGDGVGKGVQLFIAGLQLDGAFAQAGKEARLVDGQGGCGG